MSGRIDIYYGCHVTSDNYTKIMELLEKSDTYKKIGKKPFGNIIMGDVSNKLYYITSDKLSIEGSMDSMFITINKLIKTEDPRVNKGEIDTIADIHQYLVKSDNSLNIEYGWKIYYIPNKN